jgi:hypothetical protein
MPQKKDFSSCSFPDNLRSDVRLQMQHCKMVLDHGKSMENIKNSEQRKQGRVGTPVRVLARSRLPEKLKEIVRFDQCDIMQALQFLARTDKNDGNATSKSACFRYIHC